MTAETVEVRPGDWVILKGDDVIASDGDLMKILKRAEAMEDDDITISKAPRANSIFY